MARKKTDDRPVEQLTVTVMGDNGQPRLRIKTGDRTSANVLANHYQAEGSVVTITPTRD